MTWELDYSGDRRTLAEWGLVGLSRRLVNQGRDEVRFRADGLKYDAADLFAYGSVLTIYRDGVQWFYGPVIQTPRSASPRAESHDYVVAGPWWYLEELVFQRPWNGTYSSHILLNVELSGGGASIRLGTIKEQVEAVLDFAIAQGVPLQKGVIEPEITPPSDEIRDYSCAAVITKELRWCLADAFTWFDYSTSPPTFHCRLPDSLDLATLNEARMQDIQIQPRLDLVRPAVVLKYEIRNTIDGSEVMTFAVDKFPLIATGLEIGAFVLTIDQLGARVNNLAASLTTEPIHAQSISGIFRMNWWKSKKPELARPDVTMTSVTVATRGSALENELIDGQVAPWMTGVHAEQDVIQAEATYTVYDRAVGESGAKVLHDKVRVPVSVALVATDAETGDFSTTQVEEFGDPLPVGLAEFLYNRVKDTKWEGSLVLVEQEVTGSVAVGKRFSLTVPGGSAVVHVQGVSESIDTGHTSVSFGPPDHLDVPGLLALLKVGRNRLRVTPAQSYANGSLGASGALSLGQQTSKANSTEGEGQSKVFRAYDSTTEAALDTPNQTIELFAGDSIVRLQLADIDGSLPEHAKLIKIREMEVCVEGVAMRALVVCGAPYEIP